VVAAHLKGRRLVTPQPPAPVRFRRAGD